MGIQGLRQHIFFSDNVGILVLVERWRPKPRILQRATRHVACGGCGSHLGQAFYRQKGSTSANGLVVRVAFFSIPVSTLVFIASLAVINKTSSTSCASSPRVSRSSSLR